MKSFFITNMAELPSMAGFCRRPVGREIGFLIILCIPLMLLSVSAQAQNCGRIASMRGEIEVLRLLPGAGGDRKGFMAKPKMNLLCSDIILTRKASRAKLVLRNRTLMTLGPHSRVEIMNYLNKDKEVNQLKLTYGKVRTLFKDKKEPPQKLPEKGKSDNRQSRLIIKTPSAVAGVRGTDFYLAYNPNKELTEQATLTGKVEVENTVTGEKVVVEPGNQVEVSDVKPQVAEKIRQDLKQGKSLEEVRAENNIRPIAPQPIAQGVKEEIRQTSAIARRDRNFVSPEAVAILGKPQTWKLPPDEVPFDLKELKEEF